MPTSDAFFESVARAQRASPAAVSSAASVHRQSQIAAVARDKWPLLARAIARFKSDGEKGVGDTIASQLGKGGEWFKTAFATLAGRDCGCSDRQAWCNARYPYA